MCLFYNSGHVRITIIHELKQFDLCFKQNVSCDFNSMTWSDHGEDNSHGALFKDVSTVNGDRTCIDIFLLSTGKCGPMVQTAPSYYVCTSTLAKSSRVSRIWILLGIKSPLIHLLFKTDVPEHKRPITKAEKISRAMESVKRMNTVIEAPLERALTDKELHKNYPDAARLLNDVSPLSYHATQLWTYYSLIIPYVGSTKV